MNLFTSPSAKPSSLPRRDWAGALMMASIFFIASGAAGLYVSQQIGVFPDPATKHIKFLIYRIFFGELYGVDYFKFLANNKIKSIEFYAPPLIFSAAAGWWAWSFFGRLRDPFFHVEGRRLKTGKAAEAEARRESRREAGFSGPGIQIHPALALAKHQEVGSIWISAAQGGGKTQLITNFQKEILDRGDKAIFFDLVKGDYTASLPGVSIFLAPWDKRSHRWDIAQDLRTRADAQAFSSGMIPVSETDPLWGNAARSILVACILKLIGEQGTDWGWPDLARLIFEAQPGELEEAAAQFYPPALDNVRHPDSKTTQSIFKNFVTFCQPIFELAEFWNDPKAKRISLVRWLKDDETKARVIIIQGNQTFSTLTASYIRAICELLTSHVADPAFPESRERRIWWILDEFPQLGKIECLLKLLELGRSRGMAVILACQSASQIPRIYGREFAAVLKAMMGVRIFAKTIGDEEQQFVQAQIGKRVVERRQRAVSGQAGSGRVNLNDSWQRDEIDVIPSVDLEKLGVTTVKGKPYIRAIVVGHGSNVLQLDWPILKIKNIRKAIVPREQKALPVTSGSVTSNTEQPLPVTPKAAVSATPKTPESVTAGVEEVVFPTEESPIQAPPEAVIFNTQQPVESPLKRRKIRSDCREDEDE